MTPKGIVQEFYKSEALINSKIIEDFLHPEIILDWNSSKGFIQMNKSQILSFTKELEIAYVRSKARISHIISENNLVSVRYSHYVKTFENPREEMFLANFIVIWEIKEGKLFRGYQMSQLS